MISQTAIQMTTAWLRSCFSPAICNTPLERVLRVSEEAIELGQANGMTEEHALALVKQVYSKPPGEVTQEEGGLLICLMAYFGTQYEEDAAMRATCSWQAEYDRIQDPAVIEKIQGKHKTKVGTPITADGSGMVA